MKQKLLLVVLFTFLFLAARQTLAYVSTTPLKDELGSGDWQAGSHAFNNVADITESLTTLIVGTGDPEVDSQIGSSAIEVTTSLIAATYSHPPASSVEYFADLGNRLNIVKPAFAQQGVGFQGLRPILDLWKAFRNIAYLFFTVVFILIGFAIMFRLKLNPQTVISIENAIPRVVVALLLVTFSYAIAGFLIDLIYVLIGLGISVLNATGLPSQEAWNFINSGTPFSAGVLLAQGNLGGFLTGLVALFAVPAALGATIGGILGAFSGNLGVVAGLAGGAVIGSIILVLILGIVILWALLKLFFGLLKTYIRIIVSIIFAPLQIMLDAFPGPSRFGSWFRGLLANILVFPAVAIFLLIGAILIATTTPLTWSPPLLGFAGTGVGAAMQMLIGLGFIIMSPKVIDMVNEALQVKALPYGAAIGETVKPALLFPFKALAAIGRIRQVRGRREEPGIPGGPGEPRLPPSARIPG